MRLPSPDGRVEITPGKSGHRHGDGRLQRPRIPQPLGAAVHFDLLLMDFKHFVQRQKSWSHLALYRRLVSETLEGPTVVLVRPSLRLFELLSPG